MMIMCLLETCRGLVVFRLSPCSECCLFSFGNFPSVRSIKALTLSKSWKPLIHSLKIRREPPHYTQDDGPPVNRDPYPIDSPLARNNRTSLTSLSSSLARSLISLPIYYPPIFYLTLFLISPRTMEPTLSSETSAFILRTPGKFPKEHRLESKPLIALQPTFKGLKETAQGEKSINYIKR